MIGIDIFFFQAEDGIRDDLVTGVQTCALRSNIKDKGVGLGLAISRSIVDLHGGNIKISSVIGAGTEISISLPTLI